MAEKKLNEIKQEIKEINAETELMKAKEKRDKLKRETNPSLLDRLMKFIREDIL